MKTPRPWYRKQNDTWYICLKGRQIALCKGKNNKAQAERAYFLLMAREADTLPDPSTLSVAHVCDLFLDWCQRHNAPDTFDWYRRYLQSLCDLCGGLLAAKLKPFDISRWLDQHADWGDGSRRSAITAVKRAFNYAVDEGILAASPVKKVRKPPVKSRDRVLSPSEREDILGAIKDEPFREFVLAMQETGCRPSEVAHVTGANVDLEQGLWVFPEHKTAKKTRKLRIVYLTPAMIERTRRLMERYPDGPLFRNQRGQAWTRNALRCRFRRLRKKLPHLKGVVSYTYRHSFATDALVNGVGVVEVAELLGHTSTDMVMKHYQHLGEKRKHMREAAVRATKPATDS